MIKNKLLIDTLSIRGKEVYKENHKHILGREELTYPKGASKQGAHNKQLKNSH